MNSLFDRIFDSLREAEWNALKIYPDCKKEENMIKKAFKLMSVFWICSPAIFTTLRAIGVFNFNSDWLVFGILSFLSFVTMFLTYKTWED